MTSSPSAVSDRRGFALVLSLTIMALLVLVVLTTAGFLNLESRIADMAMRGAMARHNALMSGRLALAQLQLLAGPDQRVTATGGIIDPANTTWGVAPTNPAYDRMTGVWHAGPKADSRKRVLAPLERSANGYLYDTRVSEDSTAGVSPGVNLDGKAYDWSTDRERTSADSRFLGWLVSGNEGLPLAATTYTGPRTTWTLALAGRVPLLGSGSLGTTGANEGASLASSAGPPATATGRIELPPVVMPGPSGASFSAGSSVVTGYYAWWVGDEGVKARINLRDPYAGVQPDDSNVAAGGYYRLMTSLRNNFTLVKDNAGLSPFSGWDTANATNIANAINFAQLKTALASSADLSPFFHDLSFTSLGLHTDTQRGGLKRDLTAYLNLGGGVPTAIGSATIADAAWKTLNPATNDPSRPVALAGVSDATDILGNLPWLPYQATTPLSVFAGTSPKYGLMRHWLMQKAAWSTTGVATSLPVLRTSATAAATYSTSNDQNYMVAQVKNQYKTPVHPVLSQMNVYFRPAYDSTLGGTGVQAYMLVYPRIVLWNPWNVPIASQAYVVDVGNRFVVRSRVTYTTSGGGSGTLVMRYGNNVSTPFDRADNNATQWNPGLSAMAFVVPATDFKPGEALVFSAPTTNTGTMSTSVTRPYTSGGSQVLAAAPLVSAANPTPYFKAALTIIPSTGVPGDPADFATYAKISGGVNATYQFATGPGGGYDFSLQYNVMTPGYPYQNMTGQSYLLDGTGTQAYQMMDSDGYQRGNMGRWISAGETAVAYTDIRGASPGPVLAPSRYQSINYRLMWHDEPGTVGSLPENWSSPVVNPLTGSITTGRGGPFTSIGWVNNRQYNLFVQNNIRAPRFVRSPWDLCVWRRGSHDRSFGIWTNDRDPIIYTDNQYAPFDFSGRRRATPFFSATNASANHVYTLYDLPNDTLGAVSLGQFQHAPFSIFAWQPSLSLGNSFADPSSPASTSEMLLAGTGGQTTLVSSTALGGNFNDLPTAALQRDEITTNSYFIYDHAFELNTALWDSWFLSTIPFGNNGWTSVNAPWSTTTAFPNARITTLGSKQLVPDSVAMTYTPAIPSLYYASASTAVAGAFNINSTNVKAWTAFLSSARNLKVPTVLGGADSTGTPFPRNLRPQQGKVQGAVTAASFDKNVWGGYRSLTDAEIQTLATNIVAEVRKRGPFLSLADFVNRRLQPVGFTATLPAGAITGAAYTDPSNMGALQAAIEKSGLNDNFGIPLASSTTNTTYNGTSSLIQRDSVADYADAEDAMKFRPRSEARVAHRSAGAPGYLLQSDILQQLAPAMTPRSDTFTIRAYGQATDNSGARKLAEAWCEIVVQRMPNPADPDNDSSASALNPKLNFTTNASGVRTYLRPDLGRRFRIVQFRWLSPNEI